MFLCGPVVGGGATTVSRDPPRFSSTRCLDFHGRPSDWGRSPAPAETGRLPLETFPETTGRCQGCCGFRQNRGAGAPPHGGEKLLRPVAPAIPAPDRDCCELRRNP